MLYTWSTQCTWMIDTCICTTKRLKHKTWQNQIFVKEKKNFSLNAWFTLQFDYCYFYISSDSCVLYGGSMLHNPRINRLKSWVWFWLLEGKRGANEQLIKMRGDYVLICKEISDLSPLHIIHLMSVRLGKHQDSRESKTNWFPEGPDIKYYISELSLQRTQQQQKNTLKRSESKQSTRYL